MAEINKINIRELSADSLMEILEHGQFSHIYLKAVLQSTRRFCTFALLQT